MQPRPYYALVKNPSIPQRLREPALNSGENLPHFVKNHVRVVSVLQRKRSPNPFHSRDVVRQIVLGRFHQRERLTRRQVGVGAEHNCTSDVLAEVGEEAERFVLAPPTLRAIALRNCRSSDSKLSK